jgi:putative ATPase
MKDLGTEGPYAHDEAEGVAGMECLPEALGGRQYYRPTDRGREKDVAARLEAARLIRQRKETPPPRG